VDNKKTFLMLTALENSSPDQKKELIHWLTNKYFEKEEKIASVTHIFNDLGIKELTEVRIREYYDKALENLSRLNKPEERKTELYNFASYLMTRNK
jgi:geranylgeranyl diphosphate synthase type II